MWAPTTVTEGLSSSSRSATESASSTVSLSRRRKKRLVSDKSSASSSGRQSDTTAESHGVLSTPDKSQEYLAAHARCSVYYCGQRVTKKTERIRTAERCGTPALCRLEDPFSPSKMERYSNEYTSEFRERFQLPQENVLRCYSCALSLRILLQGRLYITEHYIGFFSAFNDSTIFGLEPTVVLIPWEQVTLIRKRYTALIFPNAIEIKLSNHNVYFFASFMARDKAYEFLTAQWGARLSAINMSVGAEKSHSLPGAFLLGDDESQTPPRSSSLNDDIPDNPVSLNLKEVPLLAPSNEEQPISPPFPPSTAKRASSDLSAKKALPLFSVASSPSSYLSPTISPSWQDSQPLELCDPSLDSSTAPITSSTFTNIPFFPAPFPTAPQESSGTPSLAMLEKHSSLSSALYPPLPVRPLKCVIPCAQWKCDLPTAASVLFGSGSFISGFLSHVQCKNIVATLWEPELTLFSNGESAWRNALAREHQTESADRCGSWSRDQYRSYPPGGSYKNEYPGNPPPLSSPSASLPSPNETGVAHGRCERPRRVVRYEKPMKISGRFVTSLLRIPAFVDVVEDWVFFAFSPQCMAVDITVQLKNGPLSGYFNVCVRYRLTAIDPHLTQFDAEQEVVWLQSTLLRSRVEVDTLEAFRGITEKLRDYAGRYLQSMLNCAPEGTCLSEFEEKRGENLSSLRDNLSYCSTQEFDHSITKKRNKCPVVASTGPIAHIVSKCTVVGKPPTNRNLSYGGVLFAYRSLWAAGWKVCLRGLSLAARMKDGPRKCTRVAMCHHHSWE